MSNVKLFTRVKLLEFFLRIYLGADFVGISLHRGSGFAAEASVTAFDCSEPEVAKYLPDDLQYDMCQKGETNLLAHLVVPLDTEISKATIEYRQILLHKAQLITLLLRINHLHQESQIKLKKVQKRLKSHRIKKYYYSRIEVLYPERILQLKMVLVMA